MLTCFADAGKATLGALQTITGVSCFLLGRMMTFDKEIKKIKK